jgi:hypothetical protein
MNSSSRHRPVRAVSAAGVSSATSFPARRIGRGHERLGLVQIVGRQHYGSPGRSQRSDVRPDLVTGLDVDTGRWFVEDQQAWIVQECSRDSEPALDASGESAHDIIRTLAKAYQF